jgi:SpoVK/Ycf46/Vps4 family AAA+-type ATPase
MFTPADMEFLVQKVAQTAFEREYEEGREYLVTSETFMEIIPEIRPTLTDDVIREFEEDSLKYTRY